jgi:hypothetical protein
MTKIRLLLSALLCLCLAGWPAALEFTALPPISVPPLSNQFCSSFGYSMSSREFLADQAIVIASTPYRLASGYYAMANLLRVVDLRSGQEVWRHYTPGFISACWQTTSHVLSLDQGGSLTCFDLASGQPRWQFDLGKGAMTTKISLANRLSQRSHDEYEKAVRDRHDRFGFFASGSHMIISDRAKNYWLMDIDHGSSQALIGPDGPVKGDWLVALLSFSDNTLLVNEKTRQALCFDKQGQVTTTWYLPYGLKWLDFMARPEGYLVLSNRLMRFTSQGKFLGETNQNSGGDWTEGNQGFFFSTRDDGLYAWRLDNPVPVWRQPGDRIEKAEILFQKVSLAQGFRDPLRCEIDGITGLLTAQWDRLYLLDPASGQSLASAHIMDLPEPVGKGGGNLMSAAFTCSAVPYLDSQNRRLFMPMSRIEGPLVPPAFSEHQVSDFVVEMRW